jgi:hypothetical protein
MKTKSNQRANEKQKTKIEDICYFIIIIFDENIVSKK